MEKTGLSLRTNLGTERGFIPIDSEHLVLQFDKDSRVLKYKVQRD